MIEGNKRRTVSLGKECEVCDIDFATEAEFTDHILTTVHKRPSNGNGTRTFKYKLTAKTAKANLIKGAQRKHIGVEYKQGAINIDFSDGAWILAVFPEVLNWEKGNQTFSYGDLNIKVIEAKPGMDDGSNNVDYKLVFQANGQKVV